MYSGGPLTVEHQSQSFTEPMHEHLAKIGLIAIRRMAAAGFETISRTVSPIYGDVRPLRTRIGKGLDNVSISEGHMDFKAYGR